MHWLSFIRGPVACPTVFCISFSVTVFFQQGTKAYLEKEIEEMKGRLMEKDIKLLKAEAQISGLVDIVTNLNSLVTTNGQLQQRLETREQELQTVREENERLNAEVDALRYKIEGILMYRDREAASADGQQHLG